MMNLSHVEDEPEPQSTRFAQFIHPSHQLNMEAVGMVDLVAGTKVRPNRDLAP